MFTSHSKNCFKNGKDKKSQDYSIQYLLDNKLAFGFIETYYKVKNKIFILVRNLNRTEIFFANSLEKNISYKEQFNNFFFIGKKSSDYVMLEYINIHEKCILLEDDNDLFFLSPAVDLLTHS